MARAFRVILARKSLNNLAPQTDLELGTFWLTMLSLRLPALFHIRDDSLASEIAYSAPLPPEVFLFVGNRPDDRR